MTHMADLRVHPVDVGGDTVGWRVTASLCDSNAKPLVGVDGDDAIVGALTAVPSGTTGIATLDLVPNANITPANSYYLITVKPSGAQFVVQKSAATQDLQDALVASPALVDSVLDLDALSDVTITAPVNQDVLTYHAGTSTWVNAANPGVVTDLNDLADVNTTGVVNGEVISYKSATSSWVVGEPDVKVPIGTSTQYSNVNGRWSGTFSAPQNVDGTETTFVSRSMNGFWPGVGAMFEIDAVVKCETSGNGRRVRAYSNGSLIYDSGSFNAIAGGALSIKLHCWRIPGDKLGVMARMIGDSITDYRTSSWTEVATDFTSAVTIHVTGKGTDSGDLTYVVGASNHYPVPHTLSV